MLRERRLARSLPEFLAVARELAETLGPGATVTLRGGLGAGKTEFVGAAVEALHGTKTVSSPTFTIWHQYKGTPLINHLDFYRIENDADLAETGAEEAFGPDAITFVEWPENAPGLIPRGAIRVTIAGAGDEPREIEIVRP